MLSSGARSVFCILALAATASGALAEDTKTYPVRLRDRWKTGDIVTRTGTIVDRQAVTVTLAGGKVAKEQTTETRTTYVRIEKCLEADPQGHLTKGLVHFARWSHAAGTEKDESLQGVTIEVSGRGEARTWKPVSEGAKPSDGAVAWIGTQPGLASDDDLGNELMEPKAPVAVGETWAPDKPAYFAEMAKGLALDPEKSDITLKLEGVAGPKATVLLTLTVASKGLPNKSTGALLPWIEGGTWITSVRWTRTLDGSAGAGSAVGDVSVVGVAQTTSGAKVGYDKSNHQEVTTTSGGEIPTAKYPGGEIPTAK